MRAPSESIEMSNCRRGEYVRQSGEVIEIYTVTDRSWVTLYSEDQSESWHLDENGEFVYDKGNLCQSWPSEELLWIQDQLLGGGRMTIDDVYNLWDRHAYADDDRRTALCDLSDIAADLDGTCASRIITRDEWDNVVDDLHREHSEINKADLLEYIRWAAEEGNE